MTATQLSLTVRLPGSGFVAPSLNHPLVREHNAAALAELGRADRRPVVIQVHGYNNSEEDASEAFAGFRENVRHRAWPSEPSRFCTFIEFHWPGDHPNKIVGAATFSARLQSARSAGAVLAAGLRTAVAASGRQVMLVGHSLGCGAVLSALETLDRDAASSEAVTARPVVTHAFLLAAAVRVDECRPPTGFFAARNRAYTTVFFSGRDWVLRYFFSAGHGLFDQGGMGVGQRGEPHDDRAPRWDKRIDARIGHTKYWQDWRVALTIAEHFVTGGIRTIPPWHVGAHLDPPPTREIGAQHLPVRRLAQVDSR
ncbi:MAG TPA: alpha/beta hydrolase [Propionicimonas sp.]